MRLCACVYMLGLLGRAHEKTVGGGYSWRATQALGTEWEWKVYSL